MLYPWAISSLRAGASSVEQGIYSVALDHYERAIASMPRREHQPSQPGRELWVNAAYVKRLLALHLRKRIESRAMVQTHECR